MIDAVWILFGVGLLYFGGEALVRNASVLARSWGMRPMVVGLTVVAFGTSAPELAASLTAALQGAPEIAIGNVIGSNVANVALILAITAVIYPLRTEARFLRREMPIMVGTAALLAAFLLGGGIGRAEGAVLVLFLAGYLVLLLRAGEAQEEAPEVTASFRRAYAGRASPVPWRAVLGALVGLGLLVAGAQALVAGATSLARGFGVPELIIGLTLVAVGTSLPELATSIIAAVKREPEIALGNIVGSNIFNVLGIVGATAIVRPVVVPFEAVALDLGVMLALSVLLVPFLVSGLRLGRREGTLLLGLYLAYVVALYVR